MISSSTVTTITLRVHGYRENGDITTPFDMRVMSELDRFHLAQDAANAALGDSSKRICCEDGRNNRLPPRYIRENGDDIPEVQNWKWENVNQSRKRAGGNPAFSDLRLSHIKDFDSQT